MKFRRMREVYWLEAGASTTGVMENVTPTAVIIKPAIRGHPARAIRPGDKRARPPAQANARSRRSRFNQHYPKAMLTKTISEGMT
jgi:hypothetical protein